MLARLRAGEVVLCTSLTPVPSPKIAELIGLTGFDCLWIDMEHQDYDYEEVFNICLACRASGVEPMVRVRREGRHSFARGFEVGGTGIMAPHCMGGADAAQIVRDARFHPVGLRGIDGVEAIADYGLMPINEYLEWSNRETFVVVQIEDREAVDDIAAIAATKGIDILFVGPGDLSQSYGVPGQTGSAPVQAAYERVAAAAAQNGIWWGAPAGTPEAARRLVDLGARFISTGSAIGLLRAGYANLHAAFRGIQPA